MKSILFAVFFCLSLVSFSQQKKVAADTSKIYEIVSKSAQFPGGEEHYGSYLMRNLRFPNNYYGRKIDGKVFVQFIVEKTGEISNVSVLKGMKKAFNKEATRIIEEMPNWTPAQLNGEIVRQKMVQQIAFKSE